jgi:3',5'-cyclic AMP phosphodiesterase CpdA
MTLRLFHASDIHFGGENKEAVAAAAVWLKANPADLAIITGDLTRAGLREEFAAARAWLDILPAPVAVTPGNHDVPYYSLLYRAAMPWLRFRRWLGDRVVPPKVEGLALASVNTARGVQPRLNWSKGQISSRQVTRTARRLTGAPAGVLRVVACHHPLVEIVGGPMTGRVWGGKHAADSFARARADLVLTGHVHTPFVQTYPYGDGRTYAVGAGTLSIRERGVPASFNCIEIEAECVTIVAQAWTGSRFEPYRTWRVDRRL